MIGGNDGVATPVLVASVVLGLVAAGALFGPLQPAAAGPSTAQSTLVVDDDGNAAYRSIRAAVENASAGDTVEVRPGTYEEQVVIDESIALVAPDGATLDGSTLAGQAWGLTIDAGNHAEPVVDGLTIADFYVGVYAADTTGAWTLRNVTIRNVRDDAIEAGRAAGAWTVRNATIESVDEGIDAENTSGDWTLADATITGSEDDGLDVDGSATSGAWTIRNSTVRRSGDDGIDTDSVGGAWTIRGTSIYNNRNGVQITGGSGDWSIRNSVIRNNTGYGVYAARGSGNWTISRSHLRYNVITAVVASESRGAWRIRNTTIHDSQVGVFANASTGAWTIEDSSIRDTSVPEFHLSGEGTGVFASRSTGAWTVRRTNLAGHPEHALNATGATTRGDATGNWWGRGGGPADGDCVGNVDCGDALSNRVDVAEPPTVSSGFAVDSASNVDRDRLLTMAIAGVLALLLVVLAVLAWRYT